MAMLSPRSTPHQLKDAYDSTSKDATMAFDPSAHKGSTRRTKNHSLPTLRPLELQPSESIIKSLAHHQELEEENVELKAKIAELEAELEDTEIDTTTKEARLVQQGQLIEAAASVENIPRITGMHYEVSYQPSHDSYGVRLVWHLSNGEKIMQFIGHVEDPGVVNLTVDFLDQSTDQPEFLGYVRNFEKEEQDDNSA